MLPSVINVTTLLFADDVKIVSPHSQSNLLQSSLYNVWNLSTNRYPPFNPTKCNSIVIGRVSPLQLSLVSAGNSIQVVNVVPFLLTIHCKEAILVRVCYPLQHVGSAPSWVRYAGLLAKPCWRHRLTTSNPAAGDEARKGFPRTTIWGTTMSAGSAFLIPTLTQRRPRDRIQNVFRGIGSGPQPLFYSACAAWLERSSFQSPRRVLFGDFEEKNPFQHESLSTGTCSPLLL